MMQIRGDIVVYLIKILIVFFSIFDLSFNFIPAISTGKVMVAILSLYYILKKDKKNKIINKELSIFICYFFIFVDVIAVYIFNGMPETILLSRMIYYFIYSVFLSILFTEIFTDRKDFLQALSYAIFIQACFVLLSWLVSDFRTLVDQLLVQTGNISLLSEERPPGLMNSAGAKASVILSIGAAINLNMLSYVKRKRVVISYSFMMLVNLTATFIVGRTGLVLFTFLAIAILIQKNKELILNFKFIIFIILVVLIVQAAIILIPTEFMGNITTKVQWVTGEFKSGLFQANTVTVLKNMSIRELGWDTLVGTSRIRLPDGQHDSGYIQNYQSMGLIFTIIFYVVVAAHILVLLSSKYNKKFFKDNFLFIICLVLGLFLVEIKEPFVLSYIYPLIIFTLLRLSDEKIQKNALEKERK